MNSRAFLATVKIVAVLLFSPNDSPNVSGRNYTMLKILNKWNEYD
jgi:hypothetical protein